MTTTVHKNLTGADLHEPKGADTALVNQVYVSDGAGSGSWVAASSIITNTAFTTGDLKATHKGTADTGWILWSDGSIGDASSGASIRAHADTSALFTTYWNGYNNTNCPVLPSGRGVSAAADFAAHKTISLPLAAGRVLGIAGTGAGLTFRAAGSTVGAEAVALNTTNLPPYTPSGSIAVTLSGGNLAATNGVVDNAFGGGGTTIVRTTGVSVVSVSSQTFSGTAQGGTSTAFSVMQPTTFVNVMVKL